MSPYRLFDRNLPNIVCVEGMARIVIRGPVTSVKIVGILWENGTAKSKWRDAPVGDLVQCVSISIVGLKEALSPTR
jgi:hypothetical protein